MTRSTLGTLTLALALFAACGGEEASEQEQGLAGPPEALEDGIVEPYCGPRPHPLPWTENEEYERLRRCR